MRRRRRSLHLSGWLLCGLCAFTRGDAPTGLPYSQNFEKTVEGEVPADVLVLSGNFTVKKVDGNTVLELSPDVLDNDGILAGPADQSTYAVSAKIQATSTGKRAPEFGIAANGPGQFRLWLMPAVKQLQLLKADDIKATAPYDWTSGSWTRFKLEVAKAAGGKFTIRGKAWPDGKEEPKDWMVSTEDAEAPQVGRAGFYATPYSGTPVRFDDLTVEAVKD